MMEIQENNTETWGKELATWKRGQTESQKKTTTIKKENNMKVSNPKFPAGNPQTEEQLRACSF